MTPRITRCWPAPRLAWAKWEMPDWYVACEIFGGVDAIDRSLEWEQQVGQGINDNTPGDWLAVEGPAPKIKVRPDVGVDLVDRITIVWEDRQIQNQWLQVTVKGNERTGLAQDDVFYYGNAVGDTLNDAGNTAPVDIRDVLGIAANVLPSSIPAEIDNPYDINRDRGVNIVDVLAAAANITLSMTAFKLIDLSVANLPGGPEAAGLLAGSVSAEADSAALLPAGSLLASAAKPAARLMGSTLDRSEALTHLLGSVRMDSGWWLRDQGDPGGGRPGFREGPFRLSPLL